MNDTSGPGSPTPFARYDRDSSCWRTWQDTFDEGSTSFSLTLPKWGCLHDGVLSELPTPELRTDGSDCSLLPTPVMSDHTSGRRATARKDSWKSNPGVTLTDAAWMLPTPTHSLGTKGAAVPTRYPDPKRSKDLDDAIAWMIQSTGDSSPQPSTDGNTSWEEVPLPLLWKAANDSTPT